MRMLPVALVLVATAASAQVPPPAPTAPSGPVANASAWACTKRTLLEDQSCIVEGKTQPQQASKEQAKENQREAETLAAELCRTLATGEAAEPDAGVLAVCTQRAQAATRKCGGDGSRRLLDDAGRFNPGHAKCYAALAEVVRATASVVDNAAGCCACVHGECGANEEQCVARIADEKAPDASCLETTCADACGQARIFAQKRATK